jgi:hypothetical protein
MESFSSLRPAGHITIFYFLKFETPNAEVRVPVFISPKNRMAQLHFKALGSLFFASYDSMDYNENIRTCLHAGN